MLNFIACYAMMPLLALGIAKAAGLSDPLVAGCVLIGSINGGQASNLCTYIAKGDVALSVIMTTATTVGVTFMTPLLASLVLGTMVPVDATGIVISTLQVPDATSHALRSSTSHPDPAASYQARSAARASRWRPPSVTSQRRVCMKWLRASVGMLDAPCGWDADRRAPPTHAHTQVVMAPIAAGLALNTFAPKFCRAVEPMCPVIGVIATVVLVGASVAKCATEILAAGWSLQLPLAALHLIGGLAGFYMSK
jgi:predicted Na+-dependent transporter